MSIQPGQLYYIESTLNGKVIDVEGGGPAGTKVIMYKKKHDQGAQNQLWRFTQEGFLESTNGCVLDVIGGGGIGTRLCIWNKKPHHEAQNQMWRYDPRFQTIVSVASGLVLDIWEENPNDGAHVVVHNAKSTDNNRNQRWVFSPAGGQPYGGGYGQPQPYAQPYGGAPPPQPYGGAPYGGAPYGGAPPPQPYGGAPYGGAPYGGAPQPYGGGFPQPGQPVYITSNHNGLVLDVAGGKNAPGTRVILWNRGGSNQQWRYTQDQYIENVQTGLVLDIEGMGGNGGKLIIWNKKPHHEGANQRWRYDPNTQQFISHAGNFALDVAGGEKKPGDNLIVWETKPHHDNKNQRWIMQP